MEESDSRNAPMSMSDIDDAVTTVRMSRGPPSIPSTKWDDIGGYEMVKKELEVTIIQPIKNLEKNKELGIDVPPATLLHGPSGCGKTLIAEAVGNEAGVHFLRVECDELLKKGVGESMQAIKTLFAQAREYAPCIVFVDRLDALESADPLVVGQLCVELDGGTDKNNRGVYVIGATNRIDSLSTCLRRDRFGRVIYVGLPTPDERSLILHVLSRGMPLAGDVDLDAIARGESCYNFSGSDLNSLVKNAYNLWIARSRISEQH